MNADEISRLLSEYAAGTISDADRRALMKEAAESQAVFEAVYAEQPLAELMADPDARTELRVALAGPQPRRGFARLWRPWPLAAMATVAVAFFAILIGRHVPLQEKPAAPQTVATAPAGEAEPPADVPILNRTRQPEQLFGKRDAAVASKRPDSKDAVPAAGPKSSPVQREEDRKGLDAAAAANRIAAGLKEEQTPQPLPEKAAESKVVATPPAATREGVPGRTVGSGAGGAVGGVVGGVVGGIAPPAEPAAGARTAPAPQTQTARRSADTDLAKLSLDAVAGLQYQLWKRTDGGTFTQVPPETVFRAAEAMRIEIRVPVAGYLQVAEQTADGSWALLFPGTGARAAQLPGGSMIWIPEGGALEAGGPPRDRRILAILTREPQPEIFRSTGRPRPADALTLEIVLHTGN
jgi:hypothetical protein